MALTMPVVPAVYSHGNSTTGGTLTPSNYPAVGDYIAIAYLQRAGATGGGGTVPTDTASTSGFTQQGATQVVDTANSTFQVSIWDKVAVSGDTSGSWAWTFTSASNINGKWLVWIVRGQDTSTPLGANVVQGNTADSTTVSYPNVTLPNVNDCLLWVSGRGLHHRYLDHDRPDRTQRRCSYRGC